MKRNVPDRGDILHVDLNPVSGKEQAGKRFVVVLTLAEFNRFGLAAVCPITQGGNFSREHGFAVSIMNAGTKTQGIIQCNQVRTISFKERNAKYIESAPEFIIGDILARVQTLFE